MENKAKTRIRRRNSGVRKVIVMLILFALIVIAFIKLIMPAVSTASRYTYSSIRGFYLQSQSFYFKSDKLSATKVAHFDSDNWSGVDRYEVTVNMNSKENSTKISKSDIDYFINYSYEVYDNKNNKIDDPNSYINFDITGMNTQKPEGIGRTIYAKTNADSFAFTIDPSGKPKTLEDGYYILVKIKTNSVKPYKMTLEGEFRISVGKLGMSYALEDKANNPYVEVIVTNTKDSYFVDQAFNCNNIYYQVGKEISLNEYLGILEVDPSASERCHSMNIQLDFDPTVVNIDNTSDVYIYAKAAGGSNISYKEVADGKDNKEFVNKVVFKLEAEESKVIKFYKKDITKDYTYPNSSNVDQVVTVTEI